MSKLLLIDSCHEKETILLTDDQNRMQFCHQKSQSHNRSLLSQVKEFLDQWQLPLCQLDAIIAGTGPGSFTGVRIAVSSARTLAQVCNLPVFGLNSLELYFHLYLASYAKQIIKPSLFVPFWDGRKQRLYAAGYDQQGRQVIAPGDYSVNALLDICRQQKSLQGIDCYFFNALEEQRPDDRKPRTDSSALSAETGIQIQSNPSAEKLSVFIFEQWQKVLELDPLPTYQQLLPLYIRQPDAILTAKGVIRN